MLLVFFRLQKSRKNSKNTPKTKIKLENDWALITDFINEEPIVFDRKHFNKKCRELGELHNCSRQTVRRLAIKYWVNGKTKLSLISNYHNSGGKGKQKQLTQSMAL